MKGMLIKDIKLLKNQKNSILLFGVIGLTCIFANMDVGFVLAYLTFLCCNLAVSTISYDNLDNGNAFLFTLPVSRRGYVTEKYLFSIGFGAVAWMIAVCLCLLIGTLQETGLDIREFMITAPVYLLMAFLLAAFVVPVQLKFGAEQARIIITMVMGGSFVLIVLAERAVRRFAIDVDEMFRALTGLSVGKTVGMVCLLVLLLTVLSWFISCRILEKKEF